ncbi:hypothetical protein FM106_15625 [Brachybacterium faecium]|nr:hypothetical protein FM106_15625 [Brachybacterium faecium]
MTRARGRRPDRQAPLCRTIPPGGVRGLDRRSARPDSRRFRAVWGCLRVASSTSAAGRIGSHGHLG